MGCKRLATRACVGASSLFFAIYAHAEPTATLRLDTLVDTQRGGGVIVIETDMNTHSWASAEALVWTGGSTTTGISADALAFSVRMREPHGFGELRIGRFLFASGAILPVQIDGASAMARAPWGTKVELVAGVPVTALASSAPPIEVPGIAWLIGGRVSQLIASRMTMGVSYMQRREGEEVADEEAGADLSAAPTRWLDLAAHAAYDITSPGLSDAVASAAVRVGELRFEAFALARSPSRLLPATSLFSVFGDFPTQSVGGSVHWKAAPRLDLWLVGAGQTVGGVYGGNASARAFLKLDDRGAGGIGLELRRQDVSTARWTGIRATATKPLLKTLRCGVELELVIPDDSSKGVAWPWVLGSLAWRPSTRWEIAGAIETASTPQHEFELNALARLSLFLGAK